MEKANFGQIVSFLFGIANDCLVDTYDVGDYRCWGGVEASSFLLFSGCSDMRSMLWSRRRVGVSKQRTKKQTLMSGADKWPHHS